MKPQPHSLFPRTALSALCALALGSSVALASPGVDDETIRLGMVNVQTGPASALGQGMLQGSSAVFNAVNASGGVNGRQIELLVGDDGYEPDLAIEETLIMIEDEDVFSLYGYVGTPTSNAVLPIVKELEVPLVGLFTGAGSLRSPVTEQVFNVRGSYNDEADAMVDHFVNNGAEKVSVFYQNDGFGKAVLSGATKALKKRGMSVHNTGTFERNTMAVKTGLADILRDPPDAIVMVGTYAPIAEFIKQARAVGLDAMMSTVSFIGTKNLIEAAGPAGNGVIITQVVPNPDGNDIPVVEECRRLIQKDSGESLNYINLEGCLSAKVMVEALERAGDSPTRDSLIAGLEGASSLDLGGLSLSYSSDNHQGMNVIYKTAIQDGKAVPIE
ncbi:MAG: ABC transporter substrate-binding protein [Pseudomonadota bacterium]